MLMESSPSSSSSASSDTISPMELPFLRFGFEENGEIDRGSKGKEKEGTWTDEERTAQMYARESERRMDLYSDKWEELCVRYGLKDVPHHLRVEDDSSRRIVKHESTASAESTASSSSGSSSEALSPTAPDTDITEPEFKFEEVSPVIPSYTRKIPLLSDCDDCDIRRPTLPPDLPFAPGAPSSAVCVICGSQIEGRVIHVMCGHQFDVNCMLDMFLLNVNDESIFPPRCCGQTISHDLIARYLHQDLIDLFEAKIKEVATANRLYCANVRCSRFLGSRDGAARAVQCPSCTHKTCSSCRQPEHPELAVCKPDELVTKTLVLGQSHGWQRCPQCRTLVERNMGCSHISCRCGSHWCYACGRGLGSCECHAYVALPRRVVRWVFRTRRRTGVRQDNNYLLASEALYVGAIEPTKPALVRMFSEPLKNLSRAMRVSA